MTNTQITQIAFELGKLTAESYQAGYKEASKPTIAPETKNPYMVTVDEVGKKYGYKRGQNYMDIDDFEVDVCAHIHKFKDCVIPAVCSEGCQIEPVGVCPHGCPSVLIIMRAKKSRSLSGDFPPELHPFTTPADRLQYYPKMKLGH